jgi:hypothetical protein
VIGLALLGDAVAPAAVFALAIIATANAGLALAGSLPHGVRPVAAGSRAVSLPDSRSMLGQNECGPSMYEMEGPHTTRLHHPPIARRARVARSIT